MDIEKEKAAAEKRKESRRLRQVELSEMGPFDERLRTPKYLFQPGDLSPGFVSHWVQRIIEPRFLMVHLDYGKKPIEGLDCYRRGSKEYGYYCIDWIDSRPSDLSEIFKMIDEVRDLTYKIYNAQHEAKFNASNSTRDVEMEEYLYGTLRPKFQ